VQHHYRALPLPSGCRTAGPPGPTRRPAAGYADLRTPVTGLYQAGSATHGGGGVTGIPGRNVVRQVLADRRADRLRGHAGRLRERAAVLASTARRGGR
jgi:hypothetical protein